jgi:hypothetical protein
MPRRCAAQALRDRIERMIDAEIDHCRRPMTANEWDTHCRWITSNVIEAARLWMREAAARGELP